VVKVDSMMGTNNSAEVRYVRCLSVCVRAQVSLWLYRYAPHNDVSVNDGPHIRRCSGKILLLLLLLLLLQLYNSL